MKVAFDFRKTEKSDNNIWNQELKLARKKFNDIYDRILIKRKEIRKFQVELAEINNRSCEKNSYSATKPGNECQIDLLNNLQNNKNVVVNGVDPGIHSTATMSSTPIKHLFHSLNRFSVLSSNDEQEESKTTMEDLTPSTNLNITPGFINNVTFSRHQRRKREKKAKNNIDMTSKQLQKDRLTRKIRLNKVDSKVISNYREKGNVYLHFFGNWSGQFTNIKGVKERRSFKPIVSRLSSVQRDCFQVVDEFRSTFTCHYCFEQTVPPSI
jgi:hypothetical protein